MNNVRTSLLLTLAAAASLTLPLMGQQEAASAPPASPLVSELSASLDSLERVVLPALRSARDKESADAAALRLEQASPHIHQLAHILVDDLSVEEQKQVLPMLAPRMQQLLGQLDTCCSMAAELLCEKPAALGSENFARALTDMLDSFMGLHPETTAGRTKAEDIPLALAEADTLIAGASSLLASLERLQSPEAVERELPTIREQLDELRALHRALSNTQRWSKTQLFIIMQRTRARGAEVMADLGKCTARLMNLNPPFYGSEELERLLTGLIQRQ